MSEQQPQAPDADREHSGGDPAHDITQDAPASPPTVREDSDGDTRDDEEDSDGD